MLVVVETPKYSFVKYRYSEQEGVFRREFTSPLPTLFNYGFVKGSRNEDGLPKDTIILGERLKQGVELNLEAIGVVEFTDKGRRDDKYVTKIGDREITLTDKIKIRIFFTVYSIYKRLYYLIKEHKICRCKYRGLEYT